MKVPPLSGEVVERGRKPPYIFYQETNKMYSPLSDVYYVGQWVEENNSCNSCLKGKTDTPLGFVVLFHQSIYTMHDNPVWRIRTTESG